MTIPTEAAVPRRSVANIVLLTILSVALLVLVGVGGAVAGTAAHTTCPTSKFSSIGSAVTG